MKTITIHGVPYTINDKHEVFLYKGPEIAIGSWNIETQILTLHPNWQELAAPFLASYREQVGISAKDAIQKAKELQGVASQ